MTSALVGKVLRNRSGQSARAELPARPPLLNLSKGTLLRRLRLGVFELDFRSGKLCHGGQGRTNFPEDFGS